MSKVHVLKDYLDYLKSQIGFPTDATYHDLVRLMWAKEFIWIVGNDDNRIADGLDVRSEWIDYDCPFDQITDEFGPCTFLEVLVGMSRRMEFLTDEPRDGWAWLLIVNAGLENMRDPLSRYKIKKANDILDTIIWRNYRPTGEGGFFPLTKPTEDQRKVELWYQLNAYINEMYP